MTDQLKNSMTRAGVLVLTLVPALARADMGQALEDMLKPVGDVITALVLMVFAMLGFALFMGVAVGVGAVKLFSRPKVPPAQQPTNQA